MKAVMWSKDSCAYCTMAEELMKLKGVQVEVRKIGDGWTREQLMEEVPNARSVPQIFVDGAYVGGYMELKRHLQEAA